MKVKSIRGSIKYNGTVYDEGQEFEISENDFPQVQENVEVISESISNVADKENSKENEDSDTVMVSGDEEQPFSDDEVMDIDLKDVDLNSFKVDELKKIAKQKGVKLQDKMNKSEIIKAIEQGK